jgi:hypothetical protein
LNVRPLTFGQNETFELQVLIAGAMTSIVECAATDTAADVLARLDISATRHNYSLATPSSSALDGAVLVYALPASHSSKELTAKLLCACRSKLEYVRDCRRQHIIPKLRLIEDAPLLSKEVCTLELARPT